MIEVFKHDPKAKTPTKAHANDAGIDIYALEGVTIHRGNTALVSTGISINIPPGYCGKIEGRSSISSLGVFVAGGVIDSGYNGEIKIIMNNVGYATNRGIYNIEPGQKIAQVVLYKIDTTGICEVKQLWNSDRGNKGFGSSN